MGRLFETAWAVVRHAYHDRITGEAAKMAYHLFLVIWPLVIGVFALTGILGGEPAFTWITEWMRRALPAEATTFLTQYVREITTRARPGMLSFGVLATLWIGSNAFAALSGSLNKVYGVKEGRPWWQRRLIALALVACALVLLVSGATAVIAGSSLIEATGIDARWRWIRYPLAVALLTALTWLSYYYLPNRDQRPSVRWVSVGAGVGAVLWLATTIGFDAYVSHFGRYGQTYGLVGAMIVLLVWLYLQALAFLLGGETAAVLEERRGTGG